MDEQFGDPTGTIRSEAGDHLRVAREEQGLSIAEVAERTRIPTRHLVAIETGDLASLPAPTYSIGFVKTYARLLGLDPQPVAQQFRAGIDRAAPRDIGTISYEPADPARTPTRAIAWSGFALAVLLIVGYLYWRGMSGDDAVRLAAATSDRPAAAASATPTAVQAPAPTAPEVGRSALLTATSPVWIKVYEMGGATLFMGMLQPGEHYAVPAEAADPRLITGRPNAIDVTVGATAIPALGAPERRIKDVSLKAPALLARVEPTAALAPDATPVENSAAPF